MAVRRDRRAADQPVGVDRLLAWRTYRRVPAEFLEHSDPEVHALAVETDECVGLFLRWVFSGDPNGPARKALDAGEARLARARARFTDQGVRSAARSRSAQYQASPARATNRDRRSP